MASTPPHLLVSVQYTKPRPHPLVTIEFDISRACPPTDGVACFTFLDVCVCARPWYLFESRKRTTLKLASCCRVHSRVYAVFVSAQMPRGFAILHVS